MSLVDTVLNKREKIKKIINIESPVSLSLFSGGMR